MTGDTLLELYRTVFNKRILICIFILVVLMGVSCFFETPSSEKTSTTSKEYAQKVIDQADKMLVLPVYRKNTGFAKNNIIKTKNDYLMYANIPSDFARSDALPAYRSSLCVMLFPLIAVLLFMISLFDPPDMNLRSVLFSSVYGRGTYMLRKGIALFEITTISVFVFHFIAFFIETIRFQENPFSLMSYRIYTVSGFVHICWEKSVLVYIFLRILFYSLVFFSLELVILLLYEISMKLLVVSGIVLFLFTVEIVLFYWIPSGSVYEIFKYINLFYYISFPESFDLYRNINIWGTPIDHLSVTVVLLTIIIVIILTLLYLLGKLRFPMVLKKKSNTVCERIGKYSNGRLTLEIYQLFFIHKGSYYIAAVIIALILLFRPITVEKSISQEMYESFLNRYDGRISIEAMNELSSVYDELSKADADYMDSVLLYEKGLISDEEYYTAYYSYDSLKHKRQYYQIICNQIEMTRSAVGNYCEGIGIANHYLWERILIRNQHLALFLIYIAMLLFSVSCLWYDRLTGVEKMIRQCPEGGKTEIKRKLRIICVTGGSLIIVLDILSILEVAPSYDLSGWSAYIQTLSFYNSFPVLVPIWVYMVLRLLFRLVLILPIICGVYQIYIKKVIKT